MSTASTGAAISSPAPSTTLTVGRPDAAALLLKAAWLAMALGFVMQLLTLLATALAGGATPGVVVFLRDLAQRVSWSTLVCAGLALGAGAARSRGLWMGGMGLLAAPVAFIVARLVQKGVAGAFGAAPPEAMGTGLFAAVLAIKAVEYAALGTLLHWVGAAAERKLASATAALRYYLVSGAGIGLIFGGAVLAVVYANSAPPPAAPKLASLAVNELLFPVGCSFALFAATALARRLKTTT